MTRRNTMYLFITMAAVILMALPNQTLAFFGQGKFTNVEPHQGLLSIPVSTFDDGKAHYFSVKAADGILVHFFAVKSTDGVVRTAIDACDVCYRSGKGYVQQGDFMQCTNCGMKFATSRINDVKGGCNPAPLERSIQADQLIISMDAINKNSWYCKFK